MGRLFVFLSVLMAMVAVMPQTSHASGRRADLALYVPVNEDNVAMLGIRLGFPIRNVLPVDQTLEVGAFFGTVLGGWSEGPTTGPGYDAGRMLSVAYTVRTSCIPAAGLYTGGGVGLYDIYQDHGWFPETGWIDSHGFRAGVHALIGYNPLLGLNLEARYTYIPQEIKGSDLSGFALSVGYKF